MQEKKNKGTQKTYNWQSYRIELLGLLLGLFLGVGFLTVVPYLESLALNIFDVASDIFALLVLTILILTAIMLISRFLKVRNALGPLKTIVLFLFSVLVGYIIVAISVYTISLIYFYSTPRYGGLAGSPCLPVPGYSCTNPKLNQAGKFSFEIASNAQYINKTIYNIELACAATAIGSGLPDPPTAFGSITQNGSFSGAAIPYEGKETGVALQPGQNLTIHNLTCYGMNGSPLYSGTPIQVGTRFDGYIWMNYTINETPPGASNQWLTYKIVTMDVKVT